MPEVSQIELTSNSTTVIYDIRDDKARASSIPSGGLPNQFLKKSSTTDYDVSWSTINEATTTSSGLLSTNDKIKLDSLSTGDNYALINSPVFTGIPTAPTAADGTNTTQLATTQFVQNAFKTNDAMVFKGTIGSSGASTTTLPDTHYQGWTYKVATAGLYAGTTCEIGDMIICITDGTSSNDAHWSIIQTNIDGAVVGPSSATDAHIAIFNGTSGKIIQDSGYTIGTSVPSNAIFTDTTYKNATTTASGLLSTSDKIKLDGIAENANAYTLPTASTNIKGGVKIGTNLSMDGEILNVNPNILYFPNQTINTGAFSTSIILQLNDSRINTSTVVLECTLENPEVISGGISWSTDINTLTLFGKSQFQTSANIVLGLI